MYSFEEFPNDPPSQMRLTPRSHEALLRSGLKTGDLTKKSVEEINRKYGNFPEL